MKVHKGIKYRKCRDCHCWKEKIDWKLFCVSCFKDRMRMFNRGLSSGEFKL